MTRKALVVLGLFLTYPLTYIAFLFFAIGMYTTIDKASKEHEDRVTPPLDWAERFYYQGQSDQFADSFDDYKDKWESGVTPLGLKHTLFFKNGTVKCELAELPGVGNLKHIGIDSIHPFFGYDQPPKEFDWDSMLRPVAAVHSLDFKNIDVGANALASMLLLKDLRVLSIRDARLTGDWRVLDGLPRLETIAFANCKIDPEIMSQLAALTNVTSLHLEGIETSEPDINQRQHTCDLLPLLKHPRSVRHVYIGKSYRVGLRVPGVKLHPIYIDSGRWHALGGCVLSACVFSWVLGQRLAQERGCYSIFITPRLRQYYWGTIQVLVSLLTVAVLLTAVGLRDDLPVHVAASLSPFVLLAVLEIAMCTCGINDRLFNLAGTVLFWMSACFAFVSIFVAVGFPSFSNDVFLPSVVEYCDSLLRGDAPWMELVFAVAGLLALVARRRRMSAWLATEFRFSPAELISGEPACAVESSPTSDVEEEEQQEWVRQLEIKNARSVNAKLDVLSGRHLDPVSIPSWFEFAFWFCLALGFVALVSYDDGWEHALGFITFSALWLTIIVSLRLIYALNQSRYVSADVVLPVFKDVLFGYAVRSVLLGLTPVFLAWLTISAIVIVGAWTVSEFPVNAAAEFIAEISVFSMSVFIACISERFVSRLTGAFRHPTLTSAWAAGVVCAGSSALLIVAVLLRERLRVFSRVGNGGGAVWAEATLSNTDIVVLALGALFLAWAGYETVKRLWLKIETF